MKPSKKKRLLAAIREEVKIRNNGEYVSGYALGLNFILDVLDRKNYANGEEIAFKTAAELYMDFVTNPK